MSKPVIFREQGTTCVVYCPVEGAFIPAIEVTQPGIQGSLIQFSAETPICDTLADAWAQHIVTMEELIASQHEQINQRFESALHLLRKRAGLPCKLAVVHSEESKG